MYNRHLGPIFYNYDKHFQSIMCVHTTPFQKVQFGIPKQHKCLKPTAEFENLVSNLSTLTANHYWGFTRVSTLYWKILLYNTLKKVTTVFFQYFCQFSTSFRRYITYAIDKALLNNPRNENFKEGNDTNQKESDVAKLRLKYYMINTQYREVIHAEWTMFTCIKF